ncbi:MAG TPA: DUF4331 domain-containing protein [Anaerolineales bacterium]|nr:DUF4331 domain-containing protein [Anaerolineales bacterium]
MRKFSYTMFVGLMVMALVVGLAPSLSQAASHREAPLISMDPNADITDFFMFRSYEEGHDDNIVLIMNVNPLEEPSGGPYYYNFDPTVLYTFNIDNNMDGKADDVRFEFEFKSEIRGVNRDLGLFLGYVAVPGPITALDGPGSEGLGLRQSYTVTMIKDGKRNMLARGLFAVPSNVGPRTMPDYEALVQQGIYDLKDGARVFAGQRDDPFYIDVGAIFDTLNLRDPGVDQLSGFNVHTIALEVPASWLTADEGGPADTESPVLGAYSSTYRRSTTVLRENRDNKEDADTDRENARRGSGNWVQVQRLANPLVNETIIGTVDKDRWNSLDPSKEQRFLDYYLKPRLALALQLVVGLDTGCTPFGDANCQPNPPAAADTTLAAFNRTDLVNILLKYSPDDKKLSELLRLDISTSPVPLVSQDRLSVLAGDNAGWPNGRRPIDDVTDIAVQVVGGPNYIAAGAGDNVNENDMPLPDMFPFLSTPWDGRDHVHENPDGALTPTPVGTETGTATGTVTPTLDGSVTPTGTTVTPFTATPSATNTPTATLSTTPTGSATFTPTSTATNTPSPTP